MTTQMLVAFVFGVVFVSGLILLAVFFPRPTPFQYIVFRIVLSLAAAGVAAMIPGFLSLQLNPSQYLFLRAGGALAVFAVIYFLNPARLKDPKDAEEITTQRRIVDVNKKVRANRSLRLII
jgi:uncharacterized membrane protein YedE/YeeE